MKVAAIVPAYNEARRIGQTVEALKKIPAITDILVVDDGSTDATFAAASRAGVQVIRLNRNRGKGYAVYRGVEGVTAPLIALVDADLGSSAEEVARLLEPIQKGEADMAVAVFPRPRPGEKRGGWGLVKKLAAWSIRQCSGHRLAEPLSGQRVLRREMWALLRYRPRGFGLEVGLALDLLSQGCTVIEVPTGMGHRERGRDLLSLLHRCKQLLAVLREIYLRRELLFPGGRRR